jgi:hypothetical protein
MRTAGSSAARRPHSPPHFAARRAAVWQSRGTAQPKQL